MQDDLGLRAGILPGGVLPVLGLPDGGRWIPLGLGAGRGWPFGLHHRWPRGDTAADARRHPPGQPQPGGQEGQVKPPAGPHDLPPAAGQKDAIVEQDQREGHDHHLFAAHPQRDAEDGQAVPGPGGSRTGTAEDAVEPDQQEHAHHRLGPLHDVSHRLGLQGMHDPDGGHGEGQPVTGGSVGLRKLRQPQRTASDAQQG